MARLTPKQKRFADEYLKDLNATASAGRAGYKDPNFGRQLITKPNVAAYIQKRIKDREMRTEITQDRVLEELAAIGFARGTDYACIDGNGALVLTPTERLTERQKAAIVSVKESQTGVEVKLADKVKALELLGKHLGMFDGAPGGKTAAENNLLDQIKASAQEVDESCSTDDSVASS